MTRPRRTSLLVAMTLVALVASSRAARGASVDTLLGPFTVGMSVVDLDSLASRMKLRWLGREWRYQADSSLRLYELRDTTFKGVLIYGLVFDEGRLEQVEMHASATVDEAQSFGRCARAMLVQSLDGATSLGADDIFRRYCRPRSGGGDVDVRVLARGPLSVTIIASTGAMHAGCIRC
jgi:hypothetical protein